MGEGTAGGGRVGGLEPETLRAGGRLLGTPGDGLPDEWDELVLLGASSDGLPDELVLLGGTAGGELALSIRL